VVSHGYLSLHVSSVNQPLCKCDVDIRTYLRSPWGLFGPLKVGDAILATDA
jgi:hypothetical protein